MASDIIARGIAAKAAADLKKTAADLEEFKEDTAEALAGKADLVDGKVPAEQLPSYVDDVVEYADAASFPATGEFGKIYVALDTGYTYRWSGTEYIQIGGQDLSIIVGNFAQTYDPSATYAEGDFCVHEDAFYVAVQNIDPAEPWNATHWDRTNIAAALAAFEARLQAEIDTKQEILVSGTNIKTVAGKTVLGSGNLEVTKSDVGLGNVDNTADLDKPISTAMQTALNLKADASALQAHEADVNNPHGVTKAQVGLGNVDNTSDLDKPISTATQAALDLKADASALQAHEGDTNNPHAVTKAQVGLGNVDNTSDLDKPISTATQAALDLKANVSALQAHENNTSNPHSVTKAQVGLGNVDNTSDADKPVSTAQQTALNLKADATALSAHEQDTNNPHSVTKAQVGLGNVDDTSDLDKPISTAVQAALDEKVNESDTTNFTMGDEQVAGAPMLKSMIVGTDAYNIPEKMSDLRDDLGLLVVDDKSDTVLAGIDAAEWEGLKTDHYVKKAGSVFPGFEESRYKVVLGDAEYVVRFTLDSASQAKAMFLAEENDGTDELYYEITLFVTDMGNGQTRIVMRCATVMSEPAI